MLIRYSSVSVLAQIAKGTSAIEIAGSIETAVREGRLAPGSALPSIRSLATMLRISPTTAAAALRVLRTRGVVLTRERRRSIVSFRPPLPTPSRAAGVRHGARDLAQGNPDPALLPDVGRAVARLRIPKHLYGSDPMLPALARWARAQFTRDGISADHICLVSGALDGIERVLAAHLVAGDGVVVEDPGYYPIFDLLRAMALVPIPVPIDDAGYRTKDFAAALKDPTTKAVIITPRGQNPTGAALSSARAEELRAALQRSSDVLVIEDDHQGSIAGAASQTVSGSRDRWAVVRSLAKSLGPGLRLAVIAGSAETVARVEGRFALGPGWVSHVLQHLVAELVSSPEVREGVKRAEATYRLRRRALLQALSAHGLKAHGSSGFNVWIPVSHESVVVGALLEAGWVVSPGERYRILSGPAIRVTTATLAPQEARRFAADLARVLIPARRTRAA
jgi:DNA-binding transcriptional MocR family regulator